MVDEVTNKFICNRIVRPSTPVMTIPEHKLLAPSEATQDHMLLPTLSVYQMQRMIEARQARRNLNLGGISKLNPQMHYKSNRERAEDAKWKLGQN